MKWATWSWAGLLGVATYGAVQQERHDRGEALCKCLVLAAAEDNRSLFDNLLGSALRSRRNPMSGLNFESTWRWARHSCNEIENFKAGIASACPQFVAFKDWCISLY